MNSNGIHLHELPDLNNPLLIAGFDGWGNALKIATSMATHLIDQFDAKKIAEIDPDIFYRYDDIRPVVKIEDGVFKGLETPEGAFYAAHTKSNGRDLVVLLAAEPNLRWFGFVDELFNLCHRLHIENIITLGGMYDQVVHTDRIVSAVASDVAISAMLKQKGVNSISYQGPSAIHSAIHMEGMKRGYNCISLWCHCPYYLQGVTHYGLLAHVGTLLALLGNFELNIKELEKNWEHLRKQIEDLIENNTELKTAIDEMRKLKKRGMAADLKGVIKSAEKIININDFLRPK